MKRLLNISLIIFVFLFVGIMSVKAIGTGDIKKEGNIYYYYWSGLDVNFTSSDYIFGGENVEFNIASLKVKDKSGKVKITPKIKDGTITCYIYKDDVGMQHNAEKSITIGNPTTAPTTQSTTTAQGNVQNSSYLKSISVKNKSDEEIKITPEFNKNVFEYSANVESTIRTLNISAAAESDKATVTYSKEATRELIAGENNKITITVVAEDGSKREYVLNVKREALASDTSIKELTIKEVPGFKFDPEITKYVVKIGDNITKLTIKCVPNDENSMCTVEGNNKLQDKSIVRVLVTAPDDSVTVYKLTISKKITTTISTKKIKASKNPLVIMGLSMIALGLVGGIIFVIRKKEIL